ncbi:MAG: hypothetical protein J1F61_00280 [Clostridiales bacterium]|nr:hypothetical protein [Clostridiales bacterium]
MRILKNIFSLNFLYILLIAAQVAAIIFLCLYVPAVIPLAAAYAGTFLLSAITAAVLLARGGGSEAKCAWFVLIATLPVAGSVIYLLATARGRSCGILKVNAGTQANLSACANTMCGTCAAGYDSAIYFKDGATLFERLFSEIKRAKLRVYVEFFIVCHGHIFDLFVEAIREAKQNGAEIKILVDGVGSGFKLRRRDIKRLKEAGAEVKVFHRITPFPRSRLSFRDHRKIVTVDGKLAFTGGINLADEYAGIGSPYGVWKDTGVALFGSVAKIFEGMFSAMWNGSAELNFESGGEHVCLPYCDSSPNRRFCEELYVQKISAAKSRIHIMTPYFCVSEKLAGALQFAAQRGVDVKVIIPHIPDKRYAFELSKACAQTLAPSGVEFYEFTPGFMHAKVVVCDSEVFLGSYNFDFRSMRLNYECGVMLDGSICDEVEHDFKACLSLSQPLTEGRISPAKRFSRFILRLFAPLI